MPCEAGQLGPSYLKFCTYGTIALTGTTFKHGATLLTIWCSVDSAPSRGNPYKSCSNL